MDKAKFYAVYNGQCYIKGYGRKLYKKGVNLINVTDYNGKIIAEKINVALTKALEKCSDLTSGTQIEFEANLMDGKISYISNVKQIKL